MQTANVALAYDASTTRMRDGRMQDVRETSDGSRTFLKQHFRQTLADACNNLRQRRGSRGTELYVLDNGIGAGGSLHYASQNGVTHIDANDISAKRVEECRAHWTMMRQKHVSGSTRQMTAEIHHCDAFASETRAYYADKVARTQRPYDIIIYHNSLHYGTKSKVALDELVAYWRTILSRDGVVLIVTVDSDNLCQRLASEYREVTPSNSLLVIDTNPLFTIGWHNELPPSNLTTGQAYSFSFHGSFHDAPEYVVEKRALLDAVARHGFTQRNHYNLGMHYDTTTKGVQTISADERDALYLYSAYVFTS